MIKTVELLFQDKGIDVSRLKAGKPFLSCSQLAVSPQGFVSAFAKIFQEERLFWKHFLSRDFTLEWLRNQFQLKQAFPTSTLMAQRGWYVQLTVLQAAILLNRVDTVELLLREFQLDPNSKDKRGYTAVHLAGMIPSYEILSLLYEHGADFNAKTDLGATVYDFLVWRGFGLQQLTPNVQPFSDGKILSPKEYYRKVGTRYFPHSVYSAICLFGLWSVPAKFAYDDKVFDPMEDRHPPVYLCRMEKDDESSPLPNDLQKQLEVRAKRKINAGEFVIEYSGCIYDLSLECRNEASNKGLAIVSNGRFTNLCDAYIGGSMAEYINSGPPNCLVSTMINRGVPYRVVHAIRNIEEGEALYYNYGLSHFVMRNIEPIELAPAKLKLFLQSTSFLTHFEPLHATFDGEFTYYTNYHEGIRQNYKKKGFDREACLKSYYVLQMLYYIYEKIDRLAPYLSRNERDIKVKQLYSVLEREVWFCLNCQI